MVQYILNIGILNSHWLYIEYTLNTHWIHIEYILNTYWIHIQCTLNTHWNIAKHGAIHTKYKYIE